MSTNAQRSTGVASEEEPTYFEQQRALLASEIAQSLEHVLQNINKLNRSLEGVIAVGNEFASVETLWSQFENVMAANKEQAVEGVGSGASGGEGKIGHAAGEGERREGGR